MVIVKGIPKSLLLSLSKQNFFFRRKNNHKKKKKKPKNKVK